MNLRVGFFLSSIIVCSLLLFSCVGPGSDSEMGTFTISFAQAGARASYPPNIPPYSVNPDPEAPGLEDLKFVVYFLDLDGEEIQNFTFEGNTPLRGAVPVDEYFIVMEVFLLDDDSIFASGEAIDNPITIVRGPNPTIMFQLYEGSSWSNPSLPPQRTLTGMEVLDLPTVPSYQGDIPNLTGIRVRITFIDDDGVPGTEIIEDPSLFSSLVYDVTGISRSPIIEQAIASQPVTIYYLEGAVQVLAPDFNIDVIPLLSVNFTGTLANPNMFIDSIPDFTGLTLQGTYPGGITRDLPMLPFREENWLGSNTYYLMPDGSPRRLIDIGPPPIVSYRVASGVVPVPIWGQSTGQVPRDPAHPTGTEFFIEIPYNNIYYVTSLNYTGTLTNTYPAGADATDYDWADELRQAGINLIVSYADTPLTKTFSINEFLMYTFDAGTAVAAAIIPSDPVLAPGSYLTLYYMGVTDQIPLNVVP
ncbi:MAG: hypothetical protein FWG77_08630 [Treponema sp.]|nr:hypothetical protein [Treponema sp.]